METLIRMFSAVLEVVFAMGKFFSGLVGSSSGIWTVEVLFGFILFLVAVAGMAANKLWRRPRRPRGLPWD